MGRAALAQSVAILSEEDDDQSKAQIDLCVSLRLCEVDPVTQEWIEETDEELIEVGGKWDKREKRWVGEADSFTVLRVHRGQEAAARELAEWFRRRALGARGPQWDDFKRYWTLLLVGGRRGGKSHLACIALVMFLIGFPRCRCFAVSPTLERGDELEDAIKSMLPRRWYTYRGGGSGKASQFRMVHGGRILCVSGHKQGNLKAGKVDLALYNEGQAMSKKGWNQLRGSTADKGGLVIVAANPPDEPIGRWIEELYEDAVAFSAPPANDNEKRSKVVQFTITARDNPFVEWQSLADQEADYKDEKEFRREVLGEFVPIGDVVHHAWRDGEHWRDPDPSWVDITGDFTKAKLGQAFGFVVLMDFQLTPAMVGKVCKIFRDPKEPDSEILAVVDEAVVERANEDQLLDELEGIEQWTPTGRRKDTYRGWKLPEDKEAVHCAVVMDATGFHQDGEHKRGRTSELALKARNWKYLFRPMADKLINPDVVDRCKVVNARLRSQSGKIRIVVARHCVHTARAMRLWEIKNGYPYKRSPFAHSSDAVGYGVYRFWGKPKVRSSGEGGYEGVKRLSRRDEIAGI